MVTQKKFKSIERHWIRAERDAQWTIWHANGHCQKKIDFDVAYVQLSPEAMVTDADLASFCRENILERAATPVEIFIIDSLPLTGVGKISKLTLRHDATEQVFTGLLAPLMADENLEITISVADNKRFGTTVTLAVANGDTVKRQVVESRIADVFSPFSTHYEIIWPSEL